MRGHTPEERNVFELALKRIDKMKNLLVEYEIAKRNNFSMIYENGDTILKQTQVPMHSESTFSEIIENISKLNQEKL
jgi:hypothetical protein